MIFIKTPAVYDYHLKLCDRFVARICFSSKSVFLIMIERWCGHALFILIFLAAGISPFSLAVVPIVWVYRAYTCGGSLVIFFIVYRFTGAVVVFGSVYRFTGALIVFGLYLPIHLIMDAAMLCAICASFSRARGFCFCKRDFCKLLYDVLLLLIIILLICLVEMLLLLAFFHSPGHLT